MRIPRQLAPTVVRYYATALLLVSQSGRDHLHHHRGVTVVSLVALGGPTPTRPWSGREGLHVLAVGLYIFTTTASRRLSDSGRGLDIDMPLEWP